MFLLSKPWSFAAICSIAVDNWNILSPSFGVNIGHGLLDLLLNCSSWFNMEIWEDFNTMLPLLLSFQNLQQKIFKKLLRWYAHPPRLHNWLHKLVPIYNSQFLESALYLGFPLGLYGPLSLRCSWREWNWTDQQSRFYTLPCSASSKFTCWEFDWYLASFLWAVTSLFDSIFLLLCCSWWISQVN